MIWPGKIATTFTSIFLLLLLGGGQGVVSALSSSKATPAKQSYFRILQQCYTPHSILQDVGRHVQLEGVDRDGSLSSLVLVRLSKQLIALDNNNNGKNDYSWREESSSSAWKDALDKVVQTLASADWTSSTKSLDAAVEGTMAASVLSRLLPDHYSILPWEPLLQTWDECAAQVVGQLEPHQLSGLKWSYDCFQLLLPSSSSTSCLLPTDIQQAYDSLNLPFCIRPALLCHLGDDLSVSNFCDQVEFQRDAIQTTTTKRVVQERRQTAWEGDDYVAPFSYSGKSMQRKSWSPLVQQVRDSLNQQTGQYYDGCLLNLYPDGGSGMRYHMDPDQGTLWDYETAVVSVGATRRFAFRSIPDPNQNEDTTTTTTTTTTTNKNNNNSGKKPHVFVLLHGDVTEMVDDCQGLFQHTVKTAEGKKEMAPRVSLVFKKTLASSSSRTTSGE